MRALIQRVNRASVFIKGNEFSTIGRGILVFLGIHEEDTEKDRDWIMRKVLAARIFEDDAGKMSHSVQDVKGELLVISQITLYGDLRQGNRPDMSKSMLPAQAREFYADFISSIRETSGLKVEKGVFGAQMNIELCNDGPVTLWLDSAPVKGDPQATA